MAGDSPACWVSYSACYLNPLFHVTNAYLQLWCAITPSIFPKASRPWLFGMCRGRSASADLVSGSHGVLRQLGRDFVVGSVGRGKTF